MSKIARVSWRYARPIGTGERSTNELAHVTSNLSLRASSLAIRRHSKATSELFLTDYPDSCLHLEQEGRAQISRCASGAGAGRARDTVLLVNRFVVFPNGLARRASAGNATNESGGEAEIAGGVGLGRGPRRGVYAALAGRLTAQCRWPGRSSVIDNYVDA